MTELDVRQRPDGVRLNVRVQPRAAKTELAGLYGTALKVRLHSPPIDGAANHELISFLAKSLGVSKSAVRIVAGESSRAKTVEISGVSTASVRALAHGAGRK